STTPGSLKVAVRALDPLKTSGPKREFVPLRLEIAGLTLFTMIVCAASLDAASAASFTFTLTWVVEAGTSPSANLHWKLPVEPEMTGVPTSVLPAPQFG